MEIMGMAINGTIILDNGVSLPEGTRVRILIDPPKSDGEFLRDILLEFAGTVPGLPKDMAEQHDHYLHGTSKR